jgi:hypothetical protein
MHPIFKKKATPILNGTAGISSMDSTSIFIKPLEPTTTVPKKAPLDSFTNFKQQIVEALEEIDSDEEADMPSPPPSVQQAVSTPTPSPPPKPVAKPQAKPPAAPQPKAAPVRRILNEAQFWHFIQSLNWRDRSDGPVNGSAIQNLQGDDRSMFKQFFSKYLEELRTAFKAKKFFTGFGIKDKKVEDDILSHVIARGQEFYVPVLDDPIFAEYLVNPPEYWSLMPYLTNM